MNTQRTISFNSKPLPSGLNGLERFTLALQAEAQLGRTIDRLNEKEAELTQLSASHQHEIEKAYRLEQAYNDQRAKADQMATLLDELTSITSEQKTCIDAQAEKLAQANNAINGIRQSNDRLKADLADAKRDLKALRALNPDKLQKQLKRVKEKNSELLALNSQARKEITQLKQEKTALVIDLSKVRDANVETMQENQALYLALDKAAKEANGIIDIKPLSEHGDFAIYSDKDDHEVLHVEDRKTGISRPYKGDNGVPKARPIPADVIKQCQMQIASNRANWKRLEKYSA